jgi:tetratricopeptide (TPR) repeat protein
MITPTPKAFAVTCSLHCLGKPLRAEASRRCGNFATHFEEAMNVLGDALARVGKIKEAMISFNRSLELDPQFAMTLNARGVLRMVAGDMDGGIDDLNTASIWLMWQSVAKSSLS